MHPLFLRVVHSLLVGSCRLSENSEMNKMTASNLAIVFWPTLMRPPILDLANPTRQLEWQKIMTTMIERPGCIPDPDLESAN